MLDSLKLDVNLLKGASFGTGNVAVGSFANISHVVDGFVIELYFDKLIWGEDPIDVTVIVFNDTMTKVAVFTSNVKPQDLFASDLGLFGFIPGDNVYFGIKPVKFKPGADLSGKVKMWDSNSFITLT